GPDGRGEKERQRDHGRRAGPSGAERDRGGSDERRGHGPASLRQEYGPAPPPIPSVGGRLLLLCRFEVYGDPDLVAEQQVAGVQGLVPGEPEVLPAQGDLGGEAGLLVAPG